MKIGRKVDGIATMKELRNPRHIGVVGSVKAVWKFCNVGLKGFVTHHPFKISVTGRIEVMKTPRNGKSQSRPIPQAIAWTTTVRTGILGIRSRPRLLAIMPSAPFPAVSLEPKGVLWPFGDGPRSCFFQ